MNLNSEDNIKLLCKCVSVKSYLLKQLEEKDTNYSDTMELYNKLLELLKQGDITNAIYTLKYSIPTDDFSKFSEEMLNNSPRDIADKYVNLVNKAMKSFVKPYSKEKFNEFKKSFYNGIEHLDPENNISEPGQEFSLENLNKIIKKTNPKTMDSKDFKDLSEALKKAAELLGMKKFQQYFHTVSKDIVDMKISYDASEPEKPTYKTDFILSDITTKEESHLEVSEPATECLSTYYKNLCYLYLEGDKYSKIDDNSINQETITSQMNKFLQCYKELKNMSKFNITNISNKVIFSEILEDENCIEPDKIKDLEPCSADGPEI